MPQMHLPFFPEGVEHITSALAFEKKDGQVTYFNGHMPVFIHLKFCTFENRQWLSELRLHSFDAVCADLGKPYQNSPYLPAHPPLKVQNFSLSTPKRILRPLA